MTGAIRTEEFTSLRALRALSKVWEDFRARAGGCVPFAHPAIVDLWVRRLGRGARLRVVTAWDNGTLVGYAPFMIAAEALGPFPIRAPTLRFVGNNLGYPGDLLGLDVVASSPRREVLEAIFGHLRKAGGVRQWDLGFLHARSATLATAAEVLNGGRDSTRTHPTRPFVSLQMLGSYGDYLEGLGRKTRQNFRARLRKLGRLGDVETSLDWDPLQVGRRVRQLLAAHERSWRGTPREGWFGDGSVREFLVDLSELLAGQGRCVAFTLRVNGTPIAWNVGAVEGDCYLGQLSAYDSGYAAHSPGMVLSLAMMRDLLTLGVRRVEMGPGLDQRKRSLGGQPISHVRLQGYLGWLKGVQELKDLWVGAWASLNGGS